MLLAEGIHKSFGNLNVLKGIELSVKEKEIVSIVGSSGAGNLPYCTFLARWINRMQARFTTTISQYRA